MRGCTWTIIILTLHLARVKTSAIVIDPSHMATYPLSTYLLSTISTHQGIYPSCYQGVSFIVVI